jgi:hypothetical protein
VGVAVQVAGGAGGGAAGPARYLSTLDTDTDDGVRTRRVVMPVCGVGEGTQGVCGGITSQGTWDH